MKRHRPCTVAALAVFGLLVQGCGIRVIGVREGQFSHGEGGVVVEHLPSSSPRKALHWESRDLSKGTLTLEFTTVHDRVMQYETAWFHKVEVVRERIDEPVGAYLEIAGILTLTVVLIPIALLLVIEAITPEYSPPYGRIIPGEYTVRNNVRVIDQEYRFLKPPPGSFATVRVRPVSDAPLADGRLNFLDQEYSFNRDGRIEIRIDPLIDRAAAEGVGLRFQALFGTLLDDRVDLPEIVLSAAEVMGLHESRK